MSSSTSQIPSTSIKQDIYDDDFDIVENYETNILMDSQEIEDIEREKEDEEENNEEDEECGEEGEEEEEQKVVGRKTRGKYGKKTAIHRAAERSIMSALKTDVDNLARQFCSNNTDLSLARFSKLFQTMDFATIFLGRFTNSDLVEFSENLFHYISSYMFNPLPDKQIPNYFEGEINENKWKQMFFAPEKRSDAERIFGIFIAYSLYFVQPSQFVVPIHVTVPQMDDLNEYMETVLLPDEQFDALFCLFRLSHSNAFAIYPCDGTFNPLLHRHFRLRLEPDNFEFEQRKLMNMDNFPHLRALIDSPFFKQAEQLHERYAKGKQDIVNQASSSGSEVLPQNALIQRDGPRTLVTKLLNVRSRGVARGGGWGGLKPPPRNGRKGRKIRRRISKKVKIFRLRPSKFKKFSPAALKKKEIWLLEVKNSKNFCLRRKKWKKSGFLSSKILKIFACGAKNGRNLAS
uniref:Uncharacterized protein n=1 Tax=Meloidogyne enterolobii TaxID=390850 RepID=A0A6V7WLB5_MELEN|nr:unnamed protein product [Meloidogyne enterolobii]CAD2207943.1 unnamed protein product [Meloidogyne enterolobii]